MKPFENCEIRTDELMERHVSMRVGGRAQTLCTPKDKTALINAVVHCRDNRIPHRVIGRGSNVIFDSAGFPGVVIQTNLLRKLDFERADAIAETGVRLPTLVANVVRRSLGGIEYLISVPGSVGGAVMMNAGRGKDAGQSLADHVLEVEVFDGETVSWWSRQRCELEYRRSYFQGRPQLLLLSVSLRLCKQPIRVGRRLIKERMAYVRQTQDTSFPNAGSIFREGVGGGLMGLSVGDAAYSSKTNNWIINKGSATSDDVLELIRLTRLKYPSADLEIEIIPTLAHSVCTPQSPMKRRERAVRFLKRLSKTLDFKRKLG